MYQLSSIDIYHITKTQKTLTWKPMRRERLKDQKEIEENSLIQKIIIEETNEEKENERSNYTVCEYLDLIE